MDKPIIIALDFARTDQALALLEQLAPELCRVKIGKELFTVAGPQLVRNLVTRGFDVFLDLKFHDIPNTVTRAVAAAAELGVWMISLHASGGPAMMEAARRAVDGLAGDRPHLVAVTVLTSLSRPDLAAIGLDCEPRQQVLRLTHLTRQAGLDGVVCSAAETAELRRETDAGFLLVTPGIRRAEDTADDQRRVVGPAEAMANGSDYLVVGRPITGAACPLRALEEFISAAAG